MSERQLHVTCAIIEQDSCVLAARLLAANYISPVMAEKLKEILLQNRLKKTENGNIEIYKKFWSIDGTQDKPVVHPF